MAASSPQIVLASASPRRRELLDQIGVPYQVVPVAADETPLSGEAPRDYVMRVAADKSLHALEACGHELPILGADTTVVLEGQMLGKPRDRGDGLAMLGRLSGCTHTVLSAVSLRGVNGAHWQAVSETEVTLREIGAREMAAYWDSGEPVDKAGAYAIQGLGAVFVRSISGSFSGVVGLPLYETAQLLKNAGISPLEF